MKVPVLVKSPYTSKSVLPLRVSTPVEIFRFLQAAVPAEIIGSLATSGIVQDLLEFGTPLVQLEAVAQSVFVVPVHVLIPELLMVAAVPKEMGGFVEPEIA